MKLNPKIAKLPEDLQQLEFKRMKMLIKKELIRLEKLTTPEKPTQLIILGEFNYPDKPAMPLPLFGKWKGKFKDYAKKEVVKEAMGAIGIAYFGGVDDNGQKVVNMKLAKGKGKSKTAKIEKKLKKLIPQATYNVVFSDMNEADLDSIEQAIDATPDVEEVLDTTQAATDIPAVDSTQDLKKILVSNFKELSSTFKSVKTEILPRIRTKSTIEGDMDTIIDMEDLAQEWLVIYNLADAPLQTTFAGQKTQVDDLLQFHQQLSDKLKQGGILQDTIPSLFKEGEQPAAGMDTGLSSDAINAMFSVQGLSNNCDATARYMVYKYLEDRGVIQMDTRGILDANGRLKVQEHGLNNQVSAKGNLDFEIGTIISPKDGHLQLVTEGKSVGTYTPAPNYGKAINYIQKHLANGVPVVVGISHTHHRGQGYNEGTTDHFIVIIGQKGDGFFYIDPGTSKGDNVAANLLEPVPGTPYLYEDKSGAMSSKGNYVLTTVAVYNKDRKGNNDWEKDDGLPSDGAGLNENAVGEGQIKDSVGRGGSNSYRDAVIVQTLLNQAGANLGNFGPNGDGIDGKPGKTTFTAIEVFQNKHGLTPTGLVEPNSDTWAALTGGSVSGTVANDSSDISGNTTNQTVNTVTPTVFDDDKTYDTSYQAAAIGKELHQDSTYWTEVRLKDGTKKVVSPAEYKQLKDSKQIEKVTKTWCNQLAYELSERLLGNSNPFDMLPMGKGWTNANTLAQFMRKADGVLVDKVSGEGRYAKAWEQINKGKMVYFCHEKVGGTGHVATGVPTEQLRESKYTPNDRIGRITQAGSSVGEFWIDQIWQKSLSSVEIYVGRFNEKLPNDAKPDPNLHLAMYNKITHPIGQGKIMGGIGKLQHQFEAAELQDVIASIRTVQQLLLNAGQNVGKRGVDGDCGNSTVEALKNIQRQLKIAETGYIEMNDATWQYLMGKSQPLIAKALESVAPTTTPVAAIAPEDVHFQLKGSATALSAKADLVLRDILAQAGEANPAIVNTLRSAEQQASIMYMNIKAYGAKFNRKQYKNPASAAQVVDAYEAAVAAGKAENDIIGAMLSVINRVGAANLSDHCNASNPAIDIHPSSIKNKANFEKIIRADSRVTVICPPKDTTYHIVMK